MPLKIFIDTEFTDFIDCHLISIGMVGELGEEFYAEVPYPDSACSEFVREVVIPQLGKIECVRCTCEELRTRIIGWLDAIRHNEPVEICFDYQMDWDLFIDVLGYHVPSWCLSRLIASNIDEQLLLDFHEKHGLSMHHALHDAKANRYAFYVLEDK